MDERVFKGFNGDLTISDAGVKIGGGAKRSLLTQTMRGEKMIPWAAINAVQFRKANLAGVGYLQLTLLGGGEAKSGLMQAVQDENTVTWSNFPSGTKKNAEFAEARDLILAKISADTATKTCPDCAENIKSAANVCRFCGHRFPS